MSKKPGRRVHAARVATAATAIVLGCYALCAFGLSVFVAHRLISEADVRIAPVLARDARVHLGTRGGTSVPPAQRSAGSPVSGARSGNGDLDDAPVFVWRVSHDGSVHPVTVGAPALGRGHWSATPATVEIGASPFRVEAVRSDGGWLVAGQSVADVARVRSALLLPELLFGLLLAVSTFVGSLLVGLRASAPLDVVRRRQAEFTADASHELRTPLSVVEAEVDLALRRRREPGEYESVLRRISAESRRLRRIIDDLLWLARADSGSAQADSADRTDVRAVVEACVERFAPVAEQREVALTFGVEGLGRDDAGVAAVSAPLDLLERLAGVLVDNACKYAGRGGTASVSVRATGSRVVLSVDDSGPGIPADQRSAVFDRFHRVTESGEGAGLGLAIADSIVRMTGGVWTVGDSPLGGARMEVSWRRAAGDDVGGARGVRRSGDDEGAENLVLRTRPGRGPGVGGPRGVDAGAGSDPHADALR